MELTKKDFGNIFRPAFPVDPPILSIFKECTPKILVVTDGSLSFSTSGFGLSDFVDTLKNSVIHGMTPIVKTAHRGATAADYTNFVFSSSTLSKSKYDVLFLFGYNSGGSLPPAEVNTITTFMDDGGGVFATGDHSLLGKQLCGSIPRVKGMRRWNGPSASSDQRLSTNDPGPDNTFEFSDQSDAIPQKIYPSYTGTPANSQPHYLLQHPTKKVIEVLPDHPHESECTIPSNLSDVTEWPKSPTGSNVHPLIAAISVSYGGGFTGPTKQPISSPRSFGAIGAYDGHQADVGRISTDATWHHFININLIASGSGPGLVPNADAYERVSTYFENIARWLMPKKVRRCLRWPLILTAKKLYPVVEFIPELLEQPDDISKLIEVGREAQATLSPFISRGQQQELIEDLFELYSEKFSAQIKRIRQQPDNFEEALGQCMTPVAILEQAALGALILAAAKAIPDDRDVESELKKAGGIAGLDKQAEKLLSNAMESMSKVLEKSRVHFDNVLKAM